MQHFCYTNQIDIHLSNQNHFEERTDRAKLVYRGQWHENGKSIAVDHHDHADINMTKIERGAGLGWPLFGQGPGPASPNTQLSSKQWNAQCHFPPPLTAPTT